VASPVRGGRATDAAGAVPTIETMARVLHVRIHGLDSQDRDRLHSRLDELTGEREWRGDRPWLADDASPGLFEMEYFRHAVRAAENAGATATRTPPPLSAAGFLRTGGDETDALAYLFAIRDLSEGFNLLAIVRDPDNPIAKLRLVELEGGRLPDGAPLEAILVARPIFKRLPGAVIEMYPPRALGSAFGTVEGEDERRRDWSFLVHGMRDSAPGFLEAEAEAMRIYRGLRFLS
jgi:hypothetical protein